MNQKRATLKDVAAKAGVSLASVSYAVNGTGTLGDAMRSHILQVAEELGYRQNIAAKSVRTGKSSTLGLVIPDLANPFFPNLVQAVIQRARQHGYTVVVIDVEDDPDLERKAMQTLESHGVDGIIWFPIRDENTAVEGTGNVPMVVLDRVIPGFETVRADDLAAGDLAAAHLLELGHRRIGIVSGPCSIRSMADRCKGALDRIAGAGVGAQAVFHVESGYSLDLEPAVQQALDEQDVTAIITGGDMIAIGVMRRLQAQGRRVPEDVSVVGMDDIFWAQLSTPPLTTVEIPIEEMAMEAVDAVIRRMEVDGESRRRVILEPGLVVRSSTMRLGEG